MDWLNGALLEGEQALLRIHSSECDDCSRFHARHARIDRIFQTAADHPLDPPDRIWQGIAASIAQQEAASRKPSRWAAALALLRVPQFAYGLAAAMILVVTGLVSVRTREFAPDQTEYLARLDAFEYETTGNPFLAAAEDQNPFFTLETGGSGNPFAQVGGERE